PAHLELRPGPLVRPAGQRQGARAPPSLRRRGLTRRGPPRARDLAELPAVPRDDPRNQERKPDAPMKPTLLAVRLSPAMIADLHDCPGLLDHFRVLAIGQRSEEDVRFAARGRPVN